MMKQDVNNENRQTQNKCKSLITPSMEFDETKWILSIIDNVGGEGCQPLFGHSLLLLEGVKRVIGSPHTELYIRQCEISADGSFINLINIFDKYRPDYNYGPLGKSYEVRPRLALIMMKNIEEESQQLIAGDIQIPFKRIKFTANGETHNCTSWCFEKMEIVGIERNIKPKPIYAVCIPF
ncbi:MAG: hypothetical protein K2Q14_07095 [Gammaproteobacteria bacterium]|nr:hypothetical protein [Gammaproteobacteria bacterium]